MKAWFTAAVPLTLIAFSLSVAIAKLPPAAPVDPAKAEEKKVRDAAAAATTAAQQARAEDRAAAKYLQTQKAKGNAVTPQMAANSAEMEAKAKEAAAKVAALGAPAGAPPAVAAAATAKPTVVKLEPPKK